MAQEIKNIKLTNTEIAGFIEELEVCMQKMRTERKNALRFRLSAEEILLRWQEHFGCEAVVTIIIKKRFGALNISISLQGEEFNPLNMTTDDEKFRLHIFNTLGLVPVYFYKSGVNFISLKLNKQEDSSILFLLISVFASVIIGFLGLRFMPSLVPTILNDYLLPVRTTLLNIIMAVAVPMVFFSVMRGILGADDAASFGKIGKRMMIRFVVKTAFYTALLSLPMLPLFSIDLFGSGDIANYGGALQMILDIFPETFVAPFINGNALQVIVVAIVLGFAVLILDSRADGIKSICNQFTSVFLIITGWVSKLVPVLVFMLILETIWSEHGKSLFGLWKPILVTAAACILMLLAEVITVAIKHRISPVQLIKNILPSNLVAFSTSCAMAAYSVTAEACEKKLGINKKITAFGLPLGLVAYMPAVSVYYLIILFYGLEQYGLACSVEWLLIACITVTLLSVASPPISGGTMACFAVLLTQMSVPTEAIAFALAMNVIAERFCAMADLGMLEMELILISKKEENPDSKTLQSKNICKK